MTLPNTAAGDSWRVHPSWWPTVTAEVAKPYFAELRDKIRAERDAGPVYPPPHLVFAALQTPLDDVRCVIVGQDPYHGAGQAHGLAFSVPAGVRPLPPSLRNILVELVDDLCGRDGLDLTDAGAVAAFSRRRWALRPDIHGGDLTPWARRGVLLQNTCLTVRAGAAGSHRGYGWERFTHAVLTAVSKKPRPIAWLLWGAAARHAAEDVFGARIPTTASAGAQRDTGAGAWHYVLTAPHPSPLAGRSGATFAGNRHFSRANAWLASQGAEPIDWSLTT